MSSQDTHIEEQMKQAKSVALFDYQDYRQYLLDLLESKGRGEQGRMARSIGISTSLLSLILKGEKNLTPEQALELTDYVGFPELDSDYFITLVEYDRAGTVKMKNRMRKKMNLLKQQAHKISTRVKKDAELSDEVLSIYYSSWLFTGIRNFASIGEFKTASDVAERFHLSPSQVHQVIQFCLKNGLLKKQGPGFTFGARNTHVSNESPWVNNHHHNWRLRALEKMESRCENDLFYTCPMSLSVEAANTIRSVLPEFIQQVLKIVGPSTSEKVMCWNMDWFEY